MKPRNTLFLLVMIAQSFGALAAKADCLYSLDPTSVQVEWTGYKTSEKTPVKGGFKAVQVHVKEKASKDIAKALEGASFEIDASSVSSGNEARDLNLREFFFKKWVGDSKIIGTLTHVKLNGLNGAAALKVGFGKKSKDVSVQVSIDSSNQVRIAGEIDLLKFDGQEAVQSLHQKCEELHKGKDGVSKTGTMASIAATGKLVCQTAAQH